MPDIREYINGTHLYLGIEAILTEDEKQAFLNNVSAAYPNLRGAHVADVIDIMYDHDMHLEVTEPLYDEHLVEIDTYGVPRLFALCTYLAIYIHQSGDTWAHTKVYMDRWQANRCGHRWREMPQPGEEPTDGPYVWRTCTLDKDHLYPVDHHDARRNRSHTGRQFGGVMTKRPSSATSTRSEPE